MPETLTRLPQPDKEAAKRWLGHLTRQYVHDRGWLEVNRRFHPLVAAVRTFLNAEYPNPSEREAAFDGLTLGLLAMGHFDDIRTMVESFGEEALEPDAGIPIESDGSPSVET